ncbi:unnamed protein product [Durusdinium trenchii]|uniref:Uncharacterized protein n=1 Tax=Durusdinium trenchii TaxID=1381693 RepID=A0ABP0NSK9_9DINO
MQPDVLFKELTTFWTETPAIGESLGSSLDRCTFVEAMEMVEGEHANPFSLPEELECFWLQPPPPERTEHERLQEKKLRVHEKSTCSSSYGAIRKVHDHELPMAPVSKSVSLALANAKAKVLEEERPPPHLPHDGGHQASCGLGGAAAQE